MAACARAESPSSVRRLRSQSPNSGMNKISRCSVEDDFGLVTSPLPGKQRFDFECPPGCPTTCSTLCPSSSDFFDTLGLFDDIEGQARSGKNANFKFIGTSEPCGALDVFRVFFAEDKGCSGVVALATATSEAPSTPGTASTSNWSLSPPLPPLPSAETPPLLRALLKRSIEDVQTVLDSDPEAARELFWDHDTEPPLCAAIRLMCCPRIVALLLEHGAPVDDADVHNQTPLQVLHSTWVRRQLDTSTEWAQIEQLLLDADADLSAVVELTGSLRTLAEETPTALFPGTAGQWPSMPNLGWFKETQQPMPAGWFNDALFDDCASSIVL